VGVALLRLSDVVVDTFEVVELLSLDFKVYASELVDLVGLSWTGVVVVEIIGLRVTEGIVDEIVTETGSSGWKPRAPNPNAKNPSSTKSISK